jgi:serine protease AprX
MPLFAFVIRRTRFAALAALVLCATAASVWAGPRPGASAQSAKLDAVLQYRTGNLSGRSRVIVQFRGEPDVRAITGRGGIAGRRLRLLGANVAEVSNAQLTALAGDPRVAAVFHDRPAFAMMERTSATIGAALARQDLGLTGAGVGVAVIDSGITGWHDDLYMEPGTGPYDPLNYATYPQYVPRVVHFRDFVAPVASPTNYYTEYPYDDFGHGTHVAGIIAGNGYDSSSLRSGIAPKANIVSLKVLDGAGRGYISNVIAALDYAISIKDTHNIRVINLSVGAAVDQSFNTDPLALAAKRAVDAGIVVVTAAGNLGKNAQGQPQYGGVTSPGNAPWVLTVGASSHEGTEGRGDDTVQTFSSRGPTWIDFAAKPDIVAPGVGIESLSDPSSSMFAAYSQYLLPGTDPTLWYAPYLSLSGTSMSSPVVAGTVALMFEANPRLTPNAVKAILQYTAQVYPGLDHLTQGAGFLNARGAIRMAKFFGTPQQGLGARADEIEGSVIPWSEHLIWGNYRIGGGTPLPGSNAWALGQSWGAPTTATGAKVVWGSEDLDNIVWSNDGDDNIVWSNTLDNIVWSNEGLDNIVWSNDGDDNIVWSNDCGGANCNNVVWGARGDGGFIWGTAEADDNIVWSNNLDNIVWSNDGDDNIVWSNSTLDNTVWGLNATVEPVLWNAPAVKKDGKGRGRR